MVEMQDVSHHKTSGKCDQRNIPRLQKTFNWNKLVKFLIFFFIRLARDFQNIEHREKRDKLFPSSSATILAM